MELKQTKINLSVNARVLSALGNLLLMPVSVLRVIKKMIRLCLS